MEPVRREVNAKEKMQLFLWFQGSAKLTLLYKATVHGWSNEIFHDRCDNQGATVTIVRLNNGAVFGGYSAFSYVSVTGQVGPNAANPCFVFRLYDQTGTWKPLKCEQVTNFPPIFCRPGMSSSSILFVLHSQS
jgi:hypothetical protein